MQQGYSHIQTPTDVAETRVTRVTRWSASAYVAQVLILATGARYRHGMLFSHVFICIICEDMLRLNISRF